MGYNINSRDIQHSLVEYRRKIHVVQLLYEGLFCD